MNNELPASPSEAIGALMRPVSTEIKCQFLRSLPNNLSIRDRRERMEALNRAIEVVSAMPTTKFVQEL